jgi:hypothetical protein
VLDFAKALWTVGLFDEEPIEREHADDARAARRTNTRDFTRSQTTIHNSKLVEQEGADAKKEIVLVSKRKFSPEVEVRREMEKKQKSKLVIAKQATRMLLFNNFIISCWVK